MNNSNIRFIDPDKNRNLFFATLRKRVDQYFKENDISKHSNGTMILKTIVFLSLYILPFAALLAFQPGFWWMILIWSVMGFAKSGIGMSVMHDANHGA